MNQTYFMARFWFFIAYLFMKRFIFLRFANSCLMLDAIQTTYFNIIFRFVFPIIKFVIKSYVSKMILWDESL